MVAISWVLFIIQGISIFGSFITDKQNNQAIGTDMLSMFRMPTNTLDCIRQAGFIVGNFLPAIIGVILLLIARKRQRKQNGGTLNKYIRKRSVFGLIVGLVAVFHVLYISILIDSLDVTTSLGARMNSTYQSYRIFAVISTILCLIAFFARLKWCYLIGSFVILIGFILYHQGLSKPGLLVILAIYMFLSFAIDNAKQRKQQEGQ